MNAVCTARAVTGGQGKTVREQIERPKKQQQRKKKIVRASQKTKLFPLRRPSVSKILFCYVPPILFTTVFFFVLFFIEGVISYSVIQGDIKDTGYDGREEGGILVGGIGQLCDGRHGVDQPFVKSTRNHLRDARNTWNV